MGVEQDDEDAVLEGVVGVGFEELVGAGDGDGGIGWAACLGG